MHDESVFHLRIRDNLNCVCMFWHFITSCLKKKKVYFIVLSLLESVKMLKKKKTTTLRDMEESCTCAPTNWIKELLVKYLACLSVVCYWIKLDKWKTKTGSGRPNKIKQVCTAISNTWWGLCRGLELHFSPWYSGSCQNWVNYEHRKLPFWSTMNSIWNRS